MLNLPAVVPSCDARVAMHPPHAGKAGASLLELWRQLRAKDEIRSPASPRRTTALTCKSGSLLADHSAVAVAFQWGIIVDTQKRSGPNRR